MSEPFSYIARRVSEHSEPLY